MILLLLIIVILFHWQDGKIGALQERINAMESTVHILCNPSADDEPFITVIR